MIAIYKKEMRTYFRGIIGWLFLFFFFALIGVYSYVYNVLNGYSEFEYALSSVSLLVCFLVPILTMRIMAEENRQKTDQLLFTSGVKVEAVIAGKLFAACSLVGIGCLVCCLLPLFYSHFGTVYSAPAYSALLGFFLMICTYISVGGFISTVTENQAFAAIITFAVIIFTWLSEGIGGLFDTDGNTTFRIFTLGLIILTVVIHLMMKNYVITGVFFLVTEGALLAVKLIKVSLLDGLVVKVFTALSPVSMYDNFTIGVLDIRSIIYYLSLIGLFWFLSVQSVKRKRWN